MNSTATQPKVYQGTGSAIDAYQTKTADCFATCLATPRNDIQGGLSWGSFTKSKPTPAKRKVLFSHLYNAKWTHNVNGREVPDLARLGDFLASAKSPVNKPLKKLDDLEIEKIITALSGVIRHVWK